MIKEEKAILLRELYKGYYPSFDNRVKVLFRVEYRIFGNNKIFYEVYFKEEGDV